MYKSRKLPQPAQTAAMVVADEMKMIDEAWSCQEQEKTTLEGVEWEDISDFSFESACQGLAVVAGWWDVTCWSVATPPSQWQSPGQGPV
jgi:hypothetical protein